LVLRFLASRYSLREESEIFVFFFAFLVQNPTNPWDFEQCHHDERVNVTMKGKKTKKKADITLPLLREISANCVSPSRVSLFCVRPLSLIALLREYDRARKEDKRRPSPQFKARA
jgi:hypothetical protein